MCIEAYGMRDAEGTGVKKCALQNREREKRERERERERERGLRPSRALQIFLCKKTNYKSENS